MSRETERIFKELHKVLEEKKLKNEDEIHEFLDGFMQVYNADMKDADKENSYDVYDYLDMAQEASNSLEAIRYAKQALKLDPYCLDADLIIAQEKSRNIEELKKNLERLIRKGEKQLIEQGISKEENAGFFYGIFETRPYMRVRNEYVDILIMMGKFRLAMTEIEELLKLNENDNMGLRYMLMALYSLFENEESVKVLYEKYSEDSSLMLLPIIALYYKMDNDIKMKSYIRKLKKKNPKLLKALDMLTNEEAKDEIQEIMFSQTYRPFSEEEVIVAFTQAPFLYLPMNGFMNRLYAEIAKN